MYDRVAKALEAAQLSNYLYRFRENQMDDEMVQMSLHEPSMASELNRIMPVRVHQLKFKMEFKKTAPKQEEPQQPIGDEDKKDGDEKEDKMEPAENLQLVTITASSLPSSEDKGGATAAGGDSSLLPSLRAELQAIFDAVDTDHSGRICAEELYTAIKKSDSKGLPLDACRLMISLFDDHEAKDGAKNKGSIDVLGFFSLILQVQRWQATFQKFDSDNSGYLDKREVIGPLQDMAKGYLFDQQFVDLIVEKFGTNQSQRSGTASSPVVGLDSNGFVCACAFITSFTQGFRDRDKRQEGTLSYQDFVSVLLNVWN